MEIKNTLIKESLTINNSNYLSNKLNIKDTNTNFSNNFEKSAILNPQKVVSTDNKIIEDIEMVEINKKLEDNEFTKNLRLNYSFDQDTGQSVIKIIDKNSEQIIKQIPSEEALQVLKNIEKFIINKQQSVFLSEKA